MTDDLTRRRVALGLAAGALLPAAALAQQEQTYSQDEILAAAVHVRMLAGGQAAEAEVPQAALTQVRDRQPHHRAVVHTDPGQAKTGTEQGWAFDVRIRQSR